MNQHTLLTNPDVQLSTDRDRIAELECKLASARELLLHAYIHDNYRDCGFMQMTTPQKKSFVAMLRERDMPESADNLEQFISKEAV